MSDLGRLDLNAGSLAALIESPDGYSTVTRKGTTLYPVKNADGKLFFSRSPLGDNSAGNVRVLVNFPQEQA